MQPNKNCHTVDHTSVRRKEGRTWLPHAASGGGCPGLLLALKGDLLAQAPRKGAPQATSRHSKATRRTRPLFAPDRLSSFRWEMRCKSQICHQKPDGCVCAASERDSLTMIASPRITKCNPLNTIPPCKLWRDLATQSYAHNPSCLVVTTLMCGYASVVVTTLVDHTYRTDRAFHILAMPHLVDSDEKEGACPVLY